MHTVEVKLRNDRASVEKVEEITTEKVVDDLRDLFAYANAWSEVHRKNEGPPLSFSSMLAAMAASSSDLGGWFRRYLGLRGVEPHNLTKGYAPPPGTTFPATPLDTTVSFRNALAVARRLANDGGHGGVIAARHFVAAFAACPEYHLADFLRLRIDRRAWCLEIADHLANAYPGERDAWKRYSELAVAIPVLAFNTDAPEGRDLLNIDREVEAFAQLIVARTTVTPLSVGVFGAWGSGKSFFMQRVRARVTQLVAKAQDEGRKSPHHHRVAQISFNAWHYSEGNLIACLVDHIFKNLKFKEDEDELTLRARGAELLVQIDRAKQELAGREQSLDEAIDRTNKAQQDLAEVEARYPAKVAQKQREIETAEAARAAADAARQKAEAARDAEIEAARARAPIAAGFALFRSKIDDPKLKAATEQITALIDEAKSVGSRWTPILLGVVALAIGTIATLVLGSDWWARGSAVVAAVGSFAAIATGWLKKLDGIAKRGEDYQKAINEYADGVEAKITEQHRAAIADLQSKADARKSAVEKLKIERGELAEQLGTSKEELKKLDAAREEAMTVRDQAAAALAARQEALVSLSTGTLLGEFLSDRASTDTYSKLLTILSRIRNDFDRLSRLMDRATAEYYDADKPPPPVSRIVLYIDDLDRCPKEKVIEVLRTVHLLLAFPLFVCVVAVDPRWVTTCLKDAPGVFAPQHEASDAELGERAEPADYLEKIFQIPLWLRPVPVSQRAELVRALLDPGTRPALRHEAPVALAGAPPRTSPLLDGVTLHLPVDKQEQGPGSADREATDLTIDEVELRYLDNLANLLAGNPRGLKRFVNTYRLVKSALSDVELQVFRSRMRMLGSNEAQQNRYLPYRMCMTQLAVLCTQRKRALTMVKLADQARDKDSFEGFLIALRRDDAELADRLREAVEGATPTDVTVETFKLWLERTRRYSFYV